MSWWGDPSVERFGFGHVEAVDAADAFFQGHLRLLAASGLLPFLLDALADMVLLGDLLGLQAGEGLLLMGERAAEATEVGRGQLRVLDGAGEALEEATGEGVEVAEGERETADEGSGGTGQSKHWQTSCQWHTERRPISQQHPEKQVELPTAP